MTGYLLVLCALGGTAVYAMWKGREARFGKALVALVHTLLIFVAARMLFWDFGGPPAYAGALRTVLFSALSLLSFGFLSIVMLKLEGVPEAHGPSSEDTRPERKNKTPALPKELLGETLLVGLMVALAFVMTIGGASASAKFTVFVDGLFCGGTMRLVLFVMQRANRRTPAPSLNLVSVTAMMAVSWIIYETASFQPGESAFWWIQAGRWSDVFTFALVVGALFTGCLRWGIESKAEARKREAEMETAKSELARLNKIAKDIFEDSNDLMIRQKEQALASMRKAENLEKILQMSISIQQRRDLDDVLQMIVNLIRTHLGFKTITLRLLNEKAQSFETRAHCGLSPQVEDKVVSYRIPLSEFEKLIDPRFRISKSYFIKSSRPRATGDEEPSGADPVLVTGTWGEIDMLVVPLVADDGKTIGYITVETPQDSTLSLSYVIDTLETVATLGVAGIRNAKILEALGEKDERLRTFTEQLSSLSKMKSNFVATMSHEFRTPLTSIKAYCDTLIKNVDSVDRNLLKEFLSVIDEESERLMTLVEDILDFSQIESGATKFERRPCNVNQVMINAAEELAKNFELKEVTLHQDLPAENVVVYADKDLVRQLLVNLLHNASKFCKPRGNVWMRLEEEVAAARIVVEDDGIGIPEDQLAKVFDQFYQVDSSDTREHGGSGLGLALCRSVVEWHEGRIWVQNMEGGGARFVAVIPKRQAVTRSHVMNVTSTVRKLELAKILELVVENIAEIVSASKVSLMLLDPGTDEMRIEAAIGIQEEVVEHTRVKLGEGIAGKVIEDGEPLLVKDIERDGRVARSNNEPVYGSKSFICVPVKRGDATIGVVNVSSPVGRAEFGEKDCELLVLFTKRIGIAFSRIDAFTEASAAFEQIRDAYKAILESKRFVESQDNDYVADIVARVAGKLDVDAEVRTSLPYILAVYDLGLSTIGYHILKKPRELSPKDREEIETHTIIGDGLLRAVEPESKVREIVLYHHENYDGSGYPGQLKGHAIPLGARIIRVADALRALISERPYQRKYTFDEAKEILRHRSGTFFDPKVVEAFVEAIDEHAAAAKSQRIGRTTERTQPKAPEPALGGGLSKRSIP